MVEHRLAKARVACSSPVSRSSLLRIRRSHPVRTGLGPWSFSCSARYPSGKGEVCKTFMRRFDSGPRLHHSPALLQICCLPLLPAPTRNGNGKVAATQSLGTGQELGPEQSVRIAPAPAAQRCNNTCIQVAIARESRSPGDEFRTGTKNLWSESGRTAHTRHRARSSSVVRRRSPGSSDRLRSARSSFPTRRRPFR